MVSCKSLSKTYESGALYVDEVPNRHMGEDCGGRFLKPCSLKFLIIYGSLFQACPPKRFTIFPFAVIMLLVTILLIAVPELSLLLVR